MDRMYEGEQTLHVTRPTRLLSFSFYVLFVILIGAAGAFVLDLVPIPEGMRVPFLGWTVENFAAAVLGFIALVVLLYAELRRASTRYIITDNKVVREEGILNKKTAMVPYSHLERVDLTQSFLQRILRIGTLVVDTGDDSISIEMVPKPAKIQELLSQRMGRRGQSQQATSPNR